MKVSQLFRVILYVQDMGKQVAFYRDVLGLTVKSPPGLSDYSEQFWVELQTGETTLVLHGGGGGQIGDDAPNINFRVEDIQAWRAYLIGHGIKVGDVRSPVPGTLVLDARDPEGQAISFNSFA
ncbi:MAG: VOC family protein [Anaerolineae bacterium]|nr:VOC family protein [Anaerolineae bacterium]